ncbi:hypothetical protein BOW53_01990 [Solemya pervernicosa gill symbiont]|uniref:Sulphotransferase Stf0 domain-containing protein n=2 Tax=Gammaproteobacteria incertae sedis TaxID=118884 RepID=A0A1T2LA61_9GAMM|nr:hypothetical protein [Candidatus Reidiella endopervernicosa]OOZ41960.1 hypothetical protein BOW53_01990 [Solemya pervernicosa gill symbiont]QKQ24929.1 hypothetical protein HUE57_00480 [Candidatus Reidiella endopervernicosa]
MNIFVLNTGRCGSTTFIKACGHIRNYSSDHESRSQLIGDQRLAYSDNHIEADNRLSWILGRLDKRYGDEAFYVHLSRNIDATASSFAKRESYGIMKAYREGVLLEGRNEQQSHDIAHDYIETIESNIELFLKDKSKRMAFRLENAKEDFKTFWERIGAEGNLDAALAEWDISHNASGE